MAFPFSGYAGRYVGCNPVEVGRAAEARIAELEAALHDLVAVAAANMGGLCGINNVPYPKHHVAIINTAQRLLGGREIPND